MASTLGVGEVPWWREPTKKQWASFTGAWLAWILDAFDVAIFLVAMPAISRELHVSTVATTGSMALTLLARLIGGAFAGAAADKWGRKKPLVLAVVWFALCDGLIAIAPTFGAILALRTLFGLGMGAQYAAGMTLAMENWPARSRGIASGVLQGSWATRDDQTLCDHRQAADDRERVPHAEPQGAPAEDLGRAVGDVRGVV